jgi:hypothetical protein
MMSRITQINKYESNTGPTCLPLNLVLPVYASIPLLELEKNNLI